jgi:prepilin-type N-terminal cleavage/methylation domain-containing protein
MTNRRGFTLIEVVVATVVAGIAISTAAALFATSTDAVGRMVEGSERSMRDSNGRLWLESALAGLEVDNTLDGEFLGSSTRVSFRTHVWVPLGWIEPARVSVDFDAGRIRMTALGNTVVVADSVGAATFEYLLTYGGESPWVADWRSRATAPVAVRLRLDHGPASADTMLFFIGERR